MSFCISKDQNLHKNTLKFLYPGHTIDESIRISETSGGILSNLNYAWLVRRSRLLVINCKNGLRVGSWDFGNSLQDDTATINEVEEIERPNGKEPHLVVSVNCETKGGIICIFDYVGSKVIRAIQIAEHVTNIHVIDKEQDLFSLSGPLRNFDGVLAVGTVGGNVYVLDICRQLCYEGFNSAEARDELNPCKMKIITSRNLKDLENYKKIAVCNDSHLAIFLNVVQNKKTEHFVLKTPDGLDSVHVNKEEVLISALHYCPQLCSILVGYNFGAYQLWNLMSMELVYTSQICTDHIPIIKFAIQEPADDPRAYCYVWAVYSTDDLESNILPYLVMFALCYETKEYHENYGVLYQNFQGCTVRFQKELGFGNNQSVVKPIGGKCLRLDSLILKNFNANNEIYGNDGAEDALSLCVTAWKAVSEEGQSTYMSVFDLNQWYKAQMPNSSNFDDCASYMITLCLSDLIVTESENALEVLDINLNKKTVEQFFGTQRLEEHYYPSSLSFETSCLLEHKIVNIQYQGVQRALLCQLQTSGPLCLIRPSDTYQEIVTVGLTPLFVELNVTSAITSLNNQREVILNVALEQQLTSWLCKCASEWANGSFSSAGCSLDLLTTWAFRRAITLKRKCDYLCVPLFDYSDHKLDANTVNVLSNCIRQIKNISFVFSYILTKLSQYLTNKDLLSEQCENLQMIEVYFDVLQWFFNVGLLPEYTSYGENIPVRENRVRVPYPVEELEEYYAKTRSDLLLAVNKKFSSKTSVLFIDNLINVECGGEHLGRDWKKDGGDGFYPPRSLQALLRTYLLGGIDVSNKHSVIIYLLLDLAVVLDSQYQLVKTHFVKFPAVFKVSPSFIKITQAFWQLDHGEFHPAVEHLLDPMVNQQDLKDWHHKVVLKSLLIQEQYNLALLYMNVRKPPILDDEDVLCALSLFISNNMLDEAFYLEKNFKNYTRSKRIIRHLFTECSNYGRLHSIIYRNLSEEEEAQFLQYLDEIKHPEAADLKITYFMQRSHYIEAFKTYQACEEDPMKKGLLSRLNMKARDQIVHSYKKFLPTVSYKFIESCTTEPNPTIWKEVTRPDPLSVCVRKGNDKTEYKSSLIWAALAKAKLTFNEGLNNVSLRNATTEEIPFLRTPTLMPNKKRISVPVIIPKMLITEENDDDDGPSPPKRSKLSFTETNVESNSSILNTPIISRKNQSFRSPSERNTKDLTSTPTSILKVRNSYQKDMHYISSPNLTSGPSRTPLRTNERTPLVSGRKSTRTSMVRFDVPSTSSEEQTSSLLKSPAVQNETISPRSISQSSTPKNASDTDDIYYSPNSSLNNIEELPEDKSEAKNENDDQEFASKLSPEKPTVISRAERVKLVDYDSSSSSKDVTDSGALGSPRGRRSYKRLSSDLTPIRSSPRLSRGSTFTERERGGSDHPISIIEQTPSPSTLLRSNAKKSLNRKVLEANTLARLASNVQSVETTRTEIFREEKTISSITDDDEKTETSQTKIELTSTRYSCTTMDSDSGSSSVKFDDAEKVQGSLDEVFHEDSRKEGGDLKEVAETSDVPSNQERSSDVAFISSSSASSSVHLSEKERSDQSTAAVERLSSPLTSSITRRKPLKENTLGRFSTNDNGSSMMTAKNRIKGTVAHDDEKDSTISNSAHTTLDSENGDDGNNLNSTSSPSDSFIEFLYTDLCKRQTGGPSKYSLSKNSEGKTEHSRIVREQTPIRITRRLSRRLSEERTIVSDKIELSLKKEAETSTYKDKQSRSSSVERSTPYSISTPMSGKTSKEVDNTCDFPSSSKKNDTFDAGKTIDIDTEEKSASSATKVIKVSRTGKAKHPLSRKVLENNALQRIASVYENSSNEESENLTTDTEMVDVSWKNDLSLSDSFLDLIAFGNTNKEKELLEECRKSIFARNKPNSESPDSGNVSEKIADFEIEKSELIISESVENSNQCDNKNEQENEQQMVFEILDDTTDQALPESTEPENDSVFESNQQSLHYSPPTVFERNISSSIVESSNDSSSNSSDSRTRSHSQIIEISSSDEMGKLIETSSQGTNRSSSNDNEKLNELIYGDLDDGNIEGSEMHDDLNEVLLGDEPSSISVVEDSMPSVSKSEANIKNTTMGESNESIPHHEINPQSGTSDESITAKKNIDKDTGEKEQSLLETENNKPVRRMTRRLSRQLDDQENLNNSIDQKDVSQITEAKETTGVQEEISDERPRSISARKRTRSVDVPLNTKIEDAIGSTPKTSGSLRARRKLRSASVDVPCAVDEEVVQKSPKIDKRKKKPASLSGIENIKEEKKSSRKTMEAIKEELVENYKISRRLTRRQANVLEQSLDKVDLSVIEPQDPIELLDKSEFRGTPDPQEQKIYETSPASSVSAKSKSGRPARRVKRTGSNASDDSILSAKSTTSKTKGSVTSTGSASGTRTRRNLRSASTDTDTKSPGKKKDRVPDLSDDSGESDTSVISTRSNASTKSRKSSTEDPNNTTKRKRKIASLSVLPEIKEENTEGANGSPAQNTRRGRRNIQK